MSKYCQYSISYNGEMIDVAVYKRLPSRKSKLNLKHGSIKDVSKEIKKIIKQIKQLKGIPNSEIFYTYVQFSGDKKQCDKIANTLKMSCVKVKE